MELLLPIVTLGGLLTIAKVMHSRPVVLVLENAEPSLMGIPDTTKPEYCEEGRYWESDNGSSGMCHFMPQSHRTHQRHYCAQGDLKNG